MEKSPDAFRTISEVAQDLGLPQHVLRFWESRFGQLKPLKRGGGRRYYRPDDVELLRAIQQLLYGHGYTIKGVQRLLKERGVKAVATLADDVRHLGATGRVPPDGARPAGNDDEPGAEEHERRDAAASRAASLPEAPSSVGSEPGAAAGGGSSAPLEPVHPSTRISRHDLQLLQAMQFELSECERILAAALSL